jgi:hypothetical protein
MMAHATVAGGVVLGSIDSGADWIRRKRLARAEVAQEIWLKKRLRDPRPA